MPARVLQDLIDQEAKAVFAEPDLLAVLPLGSTEFHGPRGPYGTDCDTAWEIARRVADDLEALLLPTLPYGYSPLHRDYPGTLHLEAETLRLVLRDLAASLRRHGLKRLLIIAGHWDNYEAALALKAETDDIRIEVVRVFDESVLDLAEAAPLFDGIAWHGHGGAREVAVSLYARPHVQPPAPEVVRAAFPPGETREFGELGWQGRPEEATAERGRGAAQVTAKAAVKWYREQTAGRSE